MRKDIFLEDGKLSPTNFNPLSCEERHDWYIGGDNKNGISIHSPRVRRDCENSDKST